MNRRNALSFLLGAVLLACAGLVPAQTPPASAAARTSAVPPEWDRLSPAQREAIIAVLRDRWNSQPTQRARMLQHAERWQRMTPEQRRDAHQGRHRWEKMSPDERRQARTVYEHARRLSPEQRAALREKLKAMTPEQRREWMRAQRERHRERRDDAP